MDFYAPLLSWEWNYHFVLQGGPKKKYLRYKWGYNLQPQAKPIYKAVYRDFIGVIPPPKKLRSCTNMSRAPASYKWSYGAPINGRK